MCTYIGSITQMCDERVYIYLYIYIYIFATTTPPPKKKKNGTSPPPTGPTHLSSKVPGRGGDIVQNQWYHFGRGAPPILVYFGGDWDVYWGYGLLTHGHIYM